MRVFKNKSFREFAKKEGITDEALLDAIERVEKGQIDADLGGGVIKQRIARKGQEKSGGYRSIILLRLGYSAVFAYGFSKGDMDNIHKKALIRFKELAAVLKRFSDDDFDESVKNGVFSEVKK